MPSSFRPALWIGAAVCGALAFACDGTDTGGDLHGRSGPIDTGHDANVAPSAAEAADDATNPKAAEMPVDGGGSPELGASAGCGRAANTGVKTATVMVAGKERSYIRSVHGTYDPDTPVALVFAFHGTGDDDGTGAKARMHYGLEAKAAGKAVFVYPEALPSTTPAYLGEHRWDPNKGSDDFAFFDAVRGEIEASHCIDRKRIFAAGFSNGGRMTAMVGCYRGDVVRAIAPVAPGGNTGTAPISGCVGAVGVWGGRGSADAQHEPGTALVLGYYPAANGCGTALAPTPPTGCKAYASCSADTPVVWCTYPGGHTWPSIGAAGVWGFFESFR